MSLIRQLKNEHAAIQEGLERAYALQADPKKASEVFGEVRSILLQHLAREDRDLYPVLDQYAKVDPKLKEMLEEYQSEMRSVAEVALAFFAAVDSNDLEGFRLAREFGTLSTLLANRIRSEEAKLYPAFEKLGIV